MPIAPHSQHHCLLTNHERTMRKPNSLALHWQWITSRRLDCQCVSFIYNLFCMNLQKEVLSHSWPPLFFQDHWNVNWGRIRYWSCNIDKIPFSPIWNMCFTNSSNSMCNIQLLYCFKLAPAEGFELLGQLNGLWSSCWFKVKFWIWPELRYLPFD